MRGTHQALRRCRYVWLAGAIITPAFARAQQGRDAALPGPRITRDAAVAAALTSGGTAALGRLDLAAAHADLAIARSFPNPVLSASYTQSAPQLHATLDLPLDLPWFRALRVGAARASADAMRLGTALTMAVIRYETDVSYTRALAARERAGLSRQTGRDADSLLTLARLQRDAGDASDLDVELAAINAVQFANQAISDSVAADAAIVELQLRMGVAAERPELVLADSLPALLDDTAAVGLATAPNGGGLPLRLTSARALLRSRELGLRLARRRSAVVPSLQVGVEGRDPAGGPRGPLGIVGIAVPLPLLNRFTGEIALARAARDRAAVEADVAARETGVAAARARVELRAARERLARGRELVEMSRRVAAKSVTAYREGASTLPAVLQAQRASREAYQQYLDDAVAAASAAAALRLATTTDRP